MCVCIPYSSESYTTHTHSHLHTHTYTTVQLPWATEAGALGCGMPRLRRRRRMMAADSSQCDTPQKSAAPKLPLAIRLVLPPCPSLSPCSSRLHISLSLPLFLTLSHARWLWANNSTSTCLDRFTFMKMTMLVFFFSRTKCFFWLHYCGSFNGYFYTSFYENIFFKFLPYLQIWMFLLSKV